MNINVLRHITLLFAVAALCSCKDDITLNSFSNEPKLVVYCFPSTADTTYISVSRSIPVRQYADSVQIENIDNATITYTINGQPQTVIHRGGGFYYVLASQKAGDEISVGVSADGLPDASATTTIPDTVRLGSAEERTVSLYDEDYNANEDYYQFIAEFSDPAATRDYYAARVRMMATPDTTEEQHWTYDGEENNAVLYYYPDINTQSEPLLTSISKIDDSFGFSDDYFEGLCIFDDVSVNGNDYRLHLNVDPMLFNFNGFNNSYRVELLHISPEIYHFLQSVNSVQNNEMARHAFSQIMPTASNVHGGLGVVGGWNVSRTQYIDMF